MKRILLFFLALLFALYISLNIIYNKIDFPQCTKVFEIESNHLQCEINPPFGRSYGVIITCPKESEIVGKGTLVLKNREKMEIPFNLCDCKNIAIKNSKYNSFIINYELKKGVISIDSLFTGKSSVDVSLIFEIPPPKGSILWIQFIQHGKYINRASILRTAQSEDIN